MVSWNCSSLCTEIDKPNKARQINCLPAASRTLHEHSTINPEIGARRRQAVTALGRSAKEMALRDVITKAVRDESISDFEFVRLTRWEGILNRIADKFLRNGTRDLKSIWLWESFRDPITTEQPDDPLQWLRDCLDPSTEYWFIATEEDGKYWIANATGTAIARVIEEMYGFEYYVVDREMDWILCENHHGVFIRSDQANPTTENKRVDTNRLHTPS